jgi:hypothetical protein
MRERGIRHGEFLTSTSSRQSRAAALCAKPAGILRMPADVSRRAGLTSTLYDSQAE